MSIYKDKKRGRFVFEFDRIVDQRRVRARKLLPKAWSQAQADTFDRQESARLYALATRVEKPSYSISDAVLKYLTERVPQLKSGDNIDHEIAQMYWAYKGKAITELPDVCKEYREKAKREPKTKEDEGKILEPLSAATIRNRIRYLTAACRWGWKYHNMCEHDPAERVIVPQVKNERQFFISYAQMLRLARKCPHKATRAAIRIAFYSGMRLDEICRAERQGDLMVLADTKNGTPRHIPVHPNIRGCLKYAMPDKSTISRHFRAARAAAGMEWLHFHDLRHSAASEMINAKVDLYTVGAVLGHKSAQSTKRYSHLATDSLRDAVGRIGKKSPNTQKKRAA